MSFEHRGRMPLDYQPVTYPGSVLRFRGPACRMDRPYLLCLGGSETFGRFIYAPFAAQLDTALQIDVLNYGRMMNEGLDAVVGESGTNLHSTWAARRPWFCSYHRSADLLDQRLLTQSPPRRN